jgi:hypothetical protein
MTVRACAQAPGLEELSLGGVLDLQAGPWDALGRLARLSALELSHRLCGDGYTSCGGEAYGALYAGPPPPSPPTGELPPEALPPSTVGEALRREGRLGWLLDLYPRLVPWAEDAGGQAGGEGRMLAEGRGAPAKPPTFRLAWLPPGLRTCMLDLPWGTRVDQGGGPQGGGASGQGGATQGGVEPPHLGPLARFRVEGAHVVLP